MRKTLLAATLLAACSTSIEPTNPYDAASPSGRAPVAVTISAASTDRLALPGWVSCAPAAATPCRVTVTLTADASPTELQLSADAGFAGASWAAVPAGPQPWTLPFDVPAGADGPVTIHVRLRSAAGNVSATFSTTLQRKSSAPSAPAIAFPSLVADAGAFYTSALPLPLALSAGGAHRMRLSCDATQPLADQPWISFNPGPTCVLVAGDGSRTVSAEFVDEAGNVSGVATATVWLQQTPPPPPAVAISTASGTDPGSRTIVTSPTTALTSSLAFAVSVDASAAGALLSHVDASSSAFLPATVSSTVVAFSLAAGDAASDATNLLSLRTVDRAGNVSLPATVTVVQERAAGPAAPGGLTLFTRPGSIQVSFTESPSHYARGYQLEYGPPGTYGGVGADQGTSPIQIGNPCDPAGACRYVLTGLSDFQPVSIRVTPASDLQAGVAAAAGPATPQPVGLAQVAALPTSRQNLALTIEDDRAYVVQTDGLQIYDLSDPANPAARGKFAFDAVIPDWSGSAVTVRWPYAYVAGADGMYVFDVRDDTAPAGSRRGKYASVHPGTGTVRPVVDIALRWPRAYLHVQGRYSDVGALLDVVDVSNPASPTRVSSATSAAYGDQAEQGSVAVVGTTAFLGTINNANLTAWDVSGAAPVLLSTRGFTYTLGHVVADRGPRRLVYAIERNSAQVGTLRVLDYASPAAPVEVGLAASVPSGRFAVAGGDVYLVGGGVVEVLSLADPGNPRVAGTLALPAYLGDANAVAVSGSKVLVACAAGLAVLDASHRQYPQTRGQAPSLGLLPMGGRIAVSGRLAAVPGNGVALYDVGDPAAPRMVAGNGEIFGSGSDYRPGYGYGGGAALAGDLLFSGYGTQANSGTGLVAFDLGLALGAPPSGSGSPVPCTIARTAIQPPASFYDLQAERYFGLAAHGSHLFAARGGLPSVKLLDVYDLAGFASRTACAYTAGFPAGPAPVSYTLLGEPRDVQVHRRWAFVAETDGFEILDVGTPSAPAPVVHQSGAAASAIAVRRALCPGNVGCYRIFLATASGVAVYTWVEGSAAVTAEPTLSQLGAATSLLAAHDLLIQGHSTSGGLGVFDGSTVPGAFQSYATPRAGGTVYAIGAAGRYVYANDAGALVVQELQ